MARLQNRMGAHGAARERMALGGPPKPRAGPRPRRQWLSRDCPSHERTVRRGPRPGTSRSGPLQARSSLGCLGSQCRGGLVLVVAAPPFVTRGLRVALSRVLPILLAAERGEVEEGPDGSERLYAASGREVGKKD